MKHKARGGSASSSLGRMSRRRATPADEESQRKYMGERGGEGEPRSEKRSREVRGRTSLWMAASWEFGPKASRRRSERSWVSAMTRGEGLGLLAGVASEKLGTKMEDIAGESRKMEAVEMIWGSKVGR
jgi:hypothetical protein